jgi:hypothetical protein
MRPEKSKTPTAMSMKCPFLFQRPKPNEDNNDSGSDESNWNVQIELNPIKYT